MAPGSTAHGPQSTVNGPRCRVDGQRSTVQSSLPESVEEPQQLNDFLQGASVQAIADPAVEAASAMERFFAQQGVNVR